MDNLPEDLAKSSQLTPRLFDLTVKAEAMMDSILEALDSHSTTGESAKIESAENQLNVLCHVVDGGFQGITEIS